MTILLPTYNRADVLRRTLNAISQIDRSGIDCEIVVIDNDSHDNTASIVNEFLTQIPLVYLKEVRPGKNCALNKALREHRMKELVVFADDDITPDKDWLKEIVAATDRRPDVAVFGGRIRVGWPDGKEPEWAQAAWIKSFGFSWHDHGDDDMFYTPPACPFGPNYWVRKSVFDVVPLFDETIGPRPGHRIMGSEASFLVELQRRGFKMVYCPKVQVEHRILPRECRAAFLRRRGYGFGRGQVRILGARRQRLYLRSKSLWWIATIADYVYAFARLVAGFLEPSRRRRSEVTVQAMIRLGALTESIKQRRVVR
jgi:glycosyltransferase involved in cell wall biosynthesis